MFCFGLGRPAAAHDGGRYSRLIRYAAAGAIAASYSAGIA